MKLCFLLGSGISMPAGLPSVDKITKQVLSPEDSFRSSDEVYRSTLEVLSSPELKQKNLPEMIEIKQLLLWLKGHAVIRYAADTRRRVNYEDLAYLAAQIRDDALDEYENPALGPLLCCAVNSLPGLSSAGDLGKRAEKAVECIADVVAKMLSQPASATNNHLDLFRGAASDTRFEEVNLFTLNHDYLLERYLKNNGIAVVDGFDRENDLGIRKWNPALFDSRRTDTTKPAVRLFKLHGSIDWRRFCPCKAKNEEYVGIRSNAEQKNGKDDQGRKREELGSPLFLVGTFNKMSDYLNHVFLELHYRFHRALGETTRLVVSGYGFGDKGINNRITDWMCSTGSKGARKMVLIEPRSLDDLQQTARGAIAQKLKDWKESGSLVHLELGIDDADWQTISKKLAPE